MEEYIDICIGWTWRGIALTVSTMEWQKKMGLKKLNHGIYTVDFSEF